MKVLSRIGNALIVVAAIFGGGVFAAECKKVQGVSISHELKTERNLICITYGDSGVVISVYQSGSSGAPIARNMEFLDVSDITDGSVRIEPSDGGFKIYLEYPKNIYVVGFGVDAAFVSESFMQIKLDAVDSDNPPQLIKLVLNSNVMAGLKFDTLTNSQAFDQGALRLAQPLNARVTANKAGVSYLPSTTILPSQYLSQGELVEISDFRSGWVKIYYQGDGYKVDGWIPLVDIL